RVLDHDSRLAGAISRSAGNGDRTQYIEPGSVRVGSGLLDLSNDVKRPELYDADRYFGILEVFILEFIGQLLLELGLGEACRLDGPGQGQRDEAAGIDLVVAAERVFAEHGHADLLPGLQPERLGRGLRQCLLLCLAHRPEIQAAAAAREKNAGSEEGRP